MKKLIITGLLLTVISSLSLFANDVSLTVDLPKVLIIGDSISIGYTPHVREMLKGKAVVKHHKGNAQHTGTGLREIDQWIGKTKWDVIHFNWGLWDLCYRHPESKVQGRRDKINGTIAVTLEQYEKNLNQLVKRLKKTDAKLIWAHTTLIPEKEPGRFVGDGKKFNEVATKVMKKYSVSINDIHSLTMEFPADLFVMPGDVHYTNDGYKKIAKQVADKILIILNGEQKDLGDKKTAMPFLTPDPRPNGLIKELQ